MARTKQPTQNQNPLLPHYEICHECAIRMGGVSVGYAVTMSSMECPYCKRMQTCCSIRDYNWPKLGLKRHLGLAMKLKLYTCGVNIQHEAGEIPVTLFPDVEYLKRHQKCWEQCGIVEVEVEVTKWVEPQSLFKKVKEV